MTFTALKRKMATLQEKLQVEDGTRQKMQKWYDFYQKMFNFIFFMLCIVLIEYLAHEEHFVVQILSLFFVGGFFYPLIFSKKK